MMRDFINFLKKKGIVQHLRRTYHFQEKNTNDFISHTLETLVKLENKNSAVKIYNKNEAQIIDIIGSIYDNKLSHADKKKFGEFYTPIKIVQHILNNVGYKSVCELENIKVIDPSCGCGSFLIQIVKELIKFHLRKFNIKNLSQITLNQAKVIIKRIEQNIFGIDLNPIACILCCINLYFSIYDLMRKIIDNDIEYEVPQFKIYNINALNYSNFGKFNFVVGNPPYIFLRDISSEDKTLIEQGDFETNKGQYDYYQLFVELGIKLLKEKGFLGYIVPDSLLTLSNRKIIRKYLYETTNIKSIYYIGPSFEVPIVSNIIIIVQKEKSEKERNNNVVIIKNGSGIKIKQKIIKNWDYNFLININEKDNEILEFLILNYPTIGELMKKPEYKIKIFRGVELGKEGNVIYCKECKKYIPLPHNNLCNECHSILDFKNIEKIIIDEIPKGLENQHKPFLFSMNRYKVKEKKFIDITKKGINYKKIKSYRDKIVIRQLNQNNMICATFDSDSLTSQSFYNLKILESPLREFNNFYLLGILNSKMLSYYFIKIFGSYKKLFPRILIEKIKKLPIKLPKTPNEIKISKRVEDNVKKLLFDALSNKEMDDLQSEIDSLIFTIYQVQENYRLYITEVLNYF